MGIANWLIDRARRREPDFIIGGTDNPYLLRWFIIPRNPVFNIYVHLFLRNDDDRALHDHPWLFNCSILLSGMYWEITAKGRRLLSNGDFKFRLGASAHRVELLYPLLSGGRPIPCWTLFITGPRVRQWGFHCEHGWVHWKDFTAKDDHGSIGKGCEQ